MLKYLRENGCPWDEQTCLAAAEMGHLDVLKYAHENGCPLTWQGHCYLAAEGRHLDVLQWLIDNGCPYEIDDYTKPAYESLGLA